MSAIRQARPPNEVPYTANPEDSVDKELRRTRPRSIPEAASPEASVGRSVGEEIYGRMEDVVCS
jgi:hypothetical protein